jgi:peptidoglycan/LPS O-acetylase OafA/YrhL
MPFGRRVARSASSGPERHATWLGEISYPLFLIHGPVIIALQFAMNRLVFDPRFDVTRAILVAASFVAATFLAAFVEHPVMAWRRNVRGVNARRCRRR